MNENITTRVLWLSDMHISSNYFENAMPIHPRSARLKKFLDDFESLLETISRPIDYVIFSGDLTAMSTTKDFKSFQSNIVTRIKRILGPKVKFISVPGNHDVFWKNTSFFDSLLSKLSKKISKKAKFPSSLRTDYLAERREFFNQIFVNYTSYFKKHIEPTLQGVKLANHQKKGLCGFIIDKEKNLIINFLNSSWYALGNKFDMILLDAFDSQLKKYFESRKNGTVDTEINYLRSMVKELVSIKNVSSEYGGQIIGMSPSFGEKMLENISNSSNFFVLTTFHHSPNWLQYGEKYSYLIEDNDELFLNKLLNKTELLLTGHEHVPSSVKYEKLNNGTFHLKGGMFMQDDMFAEIMSQHRFSILEINSSKFKFNEEKYYYIWEDGGSWKKDSKHCLRNIQIEKKQPIFNSTKEQFYLSLFDKTSTICSIMEKYYWPENISKKYSIKKKTLLPGLNILAFISDGITQKVILVVKSYLFYDSILKRRLNSKNEHVFTSLLKKVRPFSESLIITVIAPDFVVNKNMKAFYSDEKSVDLDEIHHSIVKHGDFIFNISRHRFFMQFESKLEGVGKHIDLNVNGISFSEVKNVQFSNQILPFWTIEKFA